MRREEKRRKEKRRKEKKREEKKGNEKKKEEKKREETRRKVKRREELFHILPSLASPVMPYFFSQLLFNSFSSIIYVICFTFYFISLSLFDSIVLSFFTVISIPLISFYFVLL